MRPLSQKQIGGQKFVSDKTKGQMDEKMAGDAELHRDVRTLVFMLKELKTTRRFLAT